MSSIGSVRILIVEDESAIADFIRRGLEADGYEVRVAADGIEGQRLALEGGWDLVILDRMLPGRDGLDVLAAIRGADPALPVILLTARTQVEDRIEGLDRGATDYLTKPFSFEELEARVRAHLRTPRPESTMAEGGRDRARPDPAHRTALGGDDPPFGPGGRAARVVDAPSW